MDLEVEGLRGLRVLDSQMEREIYGKDQAEVPRSFGAIFIRGPPQLVVQPRSETEIAAVLRYAYSRGLPIVPRGAASSPYGGAVPARGGIALDLSLMRTILALDREAGVVAVECGVRWSELHEFLKLNGGRFAEFLDEDWQLIYPYLKANEERLGVPMERLLTYEGESRRPSQVYRKVEAVPLKALIPGHD